jgi:ABC-type polysaccharide/polyol phosphate transport system ATPase subunit
VRILRLKDVHLTYPPRFKQHVEIPSMDADIDDDQVVAVDDELVPQPTGSSTRPLAESSPRAESTEALKGVSLTLAAGESLGVLGRTGSGRSTLLSVINGVLRPDKGRVAIRGFATGLMGAGAGFLAELPVRENIVRNGLLLGLRESRAEELAPQIAAFASLESFLDRPLRDLSRAHAKRLGYTVALFAEPTIFLGDEQLVVGSPQFRANSLKRLASFPDQTHGLIVVSNRAEHLLQLCTRAIVMDHGVVTFNGSVDAALREYRRAHRSGPQAGVDAAPVGADAE